MLRTKTPNYITHFCIPIFFVPIPLVIIIQILQTRLTCQTMTIVINSILSILSILQILKKLAKSIFSPIHPSTKQIMSSITSSQHNISESSKKKLQENISNIIPIITTPTTNSSAIRKTKQKYTTKIKEKVENLKFKNLTPSRPHVTSSTDCTSVEPYSKHLEYKLPIQQLFTPVTNGTS